MPRRSDAPTANAPTASPTMRLDKWLWAARLYKTRSLAAEDIEHGRVLCNGAATKPSRDIRVGDTLTIRRSGWLQGLQVLGLSAMRGPAPVAQLLYAETADSMAARAAAMEARRLGTEPALAQSHGRPTKRDRRDLAQWQRWSVSVDDADPG